MAQDSETPTHGVAGMPPANPPVSGPRLPGGAELVAALATLAWLGAVAAFFLFAPTGGEANGDPGGIGAVATFLSLLAVFLPVVLIWVAATTARNARALREEAARLQTAIDAMRQATIARNQGGVRDQPQLEQRLDALIAAHRRTEAALARLAAEVPGAGAGAPERKAALAPPRAAADRQPALALGADGAGPSEPVSVPDLLRALNFPDSAEDKAGFRALRLALEDPRAARLIRAAQDVLTLLSEDGIYMDDLQPDRARIELWRRFARGERGGAVAGLGGVRDRASLALAAGRMREDAVFRDAAHHFLRHFDRLLEEFEKNAADEDIDRLADTRSARAFMLLGRVAGIFG
jgi:hypothetical protein